MYARAVLKMMVLVGISYRVCVMEGAVLPHYHYYRLLKYLTSVNAIVYDMPSVANIII